MVKPRIFLVEQNPRFDLSDASRFGEVEYLSPVSINPLNTQQAFDWLTERFLNCDFDSDRDFLCMTGQGIMLSIALSAALLLFPSLNLLVFDARSSKYVERQITRTEGVSSGYHRTRERASAEG
jgi:hypothetical protein